MQTTADIRYAGSCVVLHSFRSLPMPKKTVKKAVKAVKKVATPVKKAAAPVKKAAKAVAKAAPRKAEHPLTKRYLHNEQEEFYAKHPNVKPLLVLFMLVAAAAFIYIIQVRYLGMM